MPTYQPVLHQSAERELNQLPSNQRNELTNILKDVAATREPTSHNSVEFLQGQEQKFRVKSGDVRAICTLCKPQLRVLAVGKRKSVYDGVDEKIESRS